MANSGKTAAELEVEVEERRRRLAGRVNEIQERLSPGQMVDEVLRYANSSGGSAFVSNLGRSVQSNPLPVALTGIGLAWLMTRSAMPASTGTSETVRSETKQSYPNARIAGSALKRTREITDETGKRYTEFADSAGARFQAVTDDLGNRAGHFTDQAGTMYSGFTDAAGNRISSFLDEAGSRLDDARGWASDTWEEAREQVQDRIGGIQHAVSGQARNLRRHAVGAGGQLQQGAGAVGHTVNDFLHEQPLIGAALAFAIGAAIAAVLPPTEQEDSLIGDTADEMKARGARMADQAYREGKRQAADVYEDVREKAASGYDRLREDLSGPTSNTTH
jgi:hypothetical protein